MTARNQTVTVELPDGDMEVTLIVAVNPYFPDRVGYDVHLPDATPAGRVTQVVASKAFGRGRWANRNAKPRKMWQAAEYPNGNILAVHPTRGAALRELLMMLDA